MRLTTLLLSTLALATMTAAPRAQLLAGEWFKVTVTLEGSGFNSESSEVEAGKIKKVVRYAQLGAEATDGSGIEYVLTLHAPTTEDTWVEAGGGTLQMLDGDETYVRTATFDLPTQPIDATDGAPNIAEITFNGPVKTKVKEEELKSAKITSVGAISYFTNDTFAFYGKAKVVLSRVDVEDLPFEVVLATAEPEPAQPDAEPMAEAKLPKG